MSRFFLRDEEFIRGNIPMTKEEVRAITMSKLQLLEDSVVVDIGAGTGSLTVNCALLANKGRVYSVEVVDEGIELIRKNAKKFCVENVVPIKGMAPVALEGIGQVDRVVVGGSRGNIAGIVNWADVNLKDNGIIVANFITLENLYSFIKCLKVKGYEYDCTQVTIAKSKTIKGATMIKGMNPVFVVTSKK